jgi:hypothetical protein
MPFPGMDAPPPDSARFVPAADLLPVVLRETEFLDVMRRHWPDVNRDTITVWAWWMPENAVAIVGDAPVLRVTPTCTGCVTRTGMTLEAGEYYVGGGRHIRVGLRAAGAGTPRLEFCIALVDRGDTPMTNCFGGRASMRLLYFRRAAGDWLRFDDRWLRFDER